MRTILTKDQIRNADDLKIEFVPCPEWADGDKESGVFMKTPTARERDAFEAKRYSAKGKNETLNLENFRAEFVAEYAVNEDCSKIFSAEDVKWLGGKSAAPVSRLFDKGMELAAMSGKDVEDMTKNSETGPSDDSLSN
jgi:hypothetical protein